MRIRRLGRTGRLTRLARRLWMGGSPLRRRTDRIEAWITAGLLAVFLAGAPLAGIAAGRWVQQGGLREQRAQQSWHQVPAVLLQSAPPLSSVYFRTSWNPEVQVLARWPGPGGRARTGEVWVPPALQAGQTTPVWVNGSGRPTGPPLGWSALVKREIGAGILAPLALAVLLLGVARAVRWAMDRRRLAGWESGWALIGPRWTKHR